MQSSDNTERELLAQKAVWLLIAVALNTLELFIPRIPLFPWLKPGLANSITIIWLLRFGLRDALFYTIIRVWISSFYFGFSLVTVGLSLSGGLLSTFVMGIAWQLLGRRQLLGTIGLAVIGAVMHNIGQLIAVYFLLTQNATIFYQLPLMGVAAIIFGTFIGLITPVFLTVLIPPGGVPQQRNRIPEMNLSRKVTLPPATGIVVLLAGSMLLFTIPDIRLLAGIAAAVTILCFFSMSRKFSILIYPVRFWFLFIFIAGIYLFFSYGTKIPSVPFITYEGATDAAAQALRLWTWLEVSLLLNLLHCNSTLFVLLKKLFPRHSETLLAGLLALEHFADVLDFVKSPESRSGLPWRTPSKALGLFVGRVQEFILNTVGEG